MNEIVTQEIGLEGKRERQDDGKNAKKKKKTKFSIRRLADLCHVHQSWHRPAVNPSLHPHIHLHPWLRAAEHLRIKRKCRCNRMMNREEETGNDLKSLKERVREMKSWECSYKVKEQVLRLPYGTQGV